MKPGDRVLLVQRSSTRWTLGTVEKVTASVITVVWDHVETRGYFSLRSASETLSRVTGDSALPRHDWIDQIAGGHPAEASSAEHVCYCKSCGVEQDDDNENGPCDPKEDKCA